jgi:hypothetical protein
MTLTFPHFTAGRKHGGRPEGLIPRWCLVWALVACTPALALERAAYDVGGRITALLSDGEDIPITTNVVAVLPTGKRVPLQGRRSEARRHGEALAWSLDFELPDSGHGTIEFKSEEDAAGVHYSCALAADSTLEIDAVEFVVDLPRAAFVKGRVTPDNAPGVGLAAVKPGSPVLFRGETKALHFAAPTGNLTIDAGFEQPHMASVVDRWDNNGRSYQLRVVLLKGPVYSGAKAGLTTTLGLTNNPPAPPPAHITLDTSRTRFQFDGFGGDYCWDTRSPIADYTMKNLKVAWARSEMKLLQWDKHRDPPSDEVRGDLEMMQRFQKQGIPFVISIWWLPERFYTDAYEQPKSAHNRLIKPEKWDELLDLIGSYLLYAKKEYSVEPDLFSFNEANIGIYVALTPETHLEAIKRIGAHFRKLGLKTKMILGDATGPRDTHKFVLEAASDPEALQYVGAVAFHSWGGGTPEQYTAWGDVAEWLNLPLLVTELGVDAAAYHNRAYTSYHYGLEEARMTQELLMYARPQGTQYWQFTNDYALARTGENNTVQPTSRFFLVKHFTDLTPQHSDALAASSDQPAVLVTAFRKGAIYTLHILNLGAGREVNLAGVPDLEWRVVETTEGGPFQQRPPLRSVGAALRMNLPAKSLVTITTGQ